MQRIFLFLATNAAVMLVITVIGSIFGLDQYGNWQMGLVSAAVFGFMGSLISLFMSKGAAKRSSHAQVITEPKNQTEQWLIETVAELSKKAGIDMPEVAIFPSMQSNAFATGWNKNKALVAVSAGMLERFEKDEIEAVMAHEIGHVANGDMVTMALMQGVVNTFVIFFARIIGSIISDKMGGRAGSRMGYYAGYFAAQTLLGFLASAITMWFSRYREFRADYTGATLGSRQGMIKALQRLQSEQDMPITRDGMPDDLLAFGISSGQLKAKFGKLFTSHPPLAKRIQTLHDMREAL